MKNKKKLGLTTLIFIALIAGAITGIIINYCIPSNKIVDDFIVSGLFYVVGQGFIRLMRMLVVPLVFCSIVCGSMAVGDTKKLGAVGLKTMLFYLCTTALAVVVALCIANVINPGIGLDMSAIKITSKVTESTQATSVTETLLNIIPTNIFESLANGTMLQIILFALILGVILANMSDRVDIVKNFFSQFNDIMMEMTMAVMKLAPIGVFCLISKTFAEIGFDVFIPLLKYMFCVLLALGVQCFGVYMSMLKIFSGLNPIIFIKNFFPVMAFAFSTSTSNATTTVVNETKVKPVTKTVKSTRSVKLTWKKKKSAKGYVIYAKAGKGKYKKVTTVGKKTSKTIKVNKDSSYKFKVKPYKLTKKNKKKYFKAYAAKAKFGSKTVKVTFKNVTGYSSYKVQMKAGKAAYKTVKTTTKGGTITYTKKKAKVGTTYKFRLKGINKVNGKTVSVTIK